MKKEIKFFVSYAHRNQALARNFLERLDDVLAPSRLYDYSRWLDTDLLVGVDWEKQIAAAIKSCNFGLLLISPAFLASRYISEFELPRFVSGGKASVPVMLQPVDFERHDLKGLEKKQIFMFAPRGGAPPRAYAECRSYRRDAFVLELFREIERKLDVLSVENKNASPPDPTADRRLLELASQACRRRGTPRYFLDSLRLTKKQKAALYDKVVLQESGKKAKTNPFR